MEPDKEKEVQLPPIPAGEVEKFQGFKVEDRNVLNEIFRFIGGTSQVLKEIQRQGIETNIHLKQLNGKVADQERRLSDFEGFKKSVSDASEKSSKEIANRNSRITSSIWSVAMFIVLSVVAVFLSKIFHVNIGVSP